MQRRATLSHWLCGCAALLFCLGASQAQTPDAAQPARIAIIIDDMGGQKSAGLRAVNLPGAVTYAFLPHSPYGKSLAEEAHRQGKEVMLHLPMQAMGANRLGPGGLTLDMDRAQLRQTLHTDLASIPHVAGINNHMGSLLTRHPGHMAWLMEEIKRLDNLYFIDSRTTHKTVAEQLAREHDVPSRQRDVFLDDDASAKAVARQFERLIDKARKNGSAIGIGHPYDSTLAVLAQRLAGLEAMGISLVPVSQLIFPPSSPAILAQDQPATPGALVFRAETKETAPDSPAFAHQN